MPNSENALSDEGDIVSALDMTYNHIPFPFGAPEPEHFRKFVDAMNSVSDRMVWIHCVVNHRASAFLYLYRRLVDKISEEEASKVLLPSWQPNEVWKRFLKLSHRDMEID